MSNIYSFHFFDVEFIWKHKINPFMNIIVSGKHLEVGDSLREHASSNLHKSVKKYFPNPVNAHVTISKNANEFHTHITLNNGTGVHLTVNSDANDADPYKSFDKALKKIVHQLEKYKSRITDHHKQNHHEDFFAEVRKYTLLNDADEAVDALNPTIVAEKQVAIRVLSVADAIMHMNLQNLPAFMFINAASKKLSMIYLRKDGNVSWVDTNYDMSQQSASA